MSNRARCFVLAALLAMLAGCGQTGALVLPGTQSAPAADPSASPDEDEEEDEAR